MEENIVMPDLFGEDIITSERLYELLSEKKYSEVKHELEDLAPPDLAELFFELDEKYHTILFRLLPKEQAADTFVEMDSDLQENLIGRFSDRELSDILDEL